MGATAAEGGKPISATTARDRLPVAVSFSRRSAHVTQPFYCLWEGPVGRLWGYTPIEAVPQEELFWLLLDIPWFRGQVQRDRFPLRS